MVDPQNTSTDVNERTTLFQRVTDWLLSTDATQRGYLRVLLLTAWIFVVAVGLMYFGVAAHLFDKKQMLLLAACCSTSTLVFYLIMRSGLNKKFSAPTLVIPQTVVAQTWIIFAYAMTGPVHGGVLILLALVMVFGMFNMPARQARLVALYCIVLLGITIWYKSVTDPLVYIPAVEAVHFVLAATVLLAISQLAAKLSHMSNRLKAQKNDLEQAVAHIQSMAIHDELTGLYNRRYMRTVIEEHINRQTRGGQTFYVALLDLDHFKRINDTYGHHTGDEVLKSLAAQVSKQLRNTDVFGRWGGEEFLLLCLDPKPESHDLSEPPAIRFAAAGSMQRKFGIADHVFGRHGGT